MSANNIAYTLDHIRQQVNRKLPFPDHEHDGDYHMNPDFYRLVGSRDSIDAAVLIGLVERNEEVLLVLTKRAERLNAHSGQIAFPGGKIDPTDTSPEDAALREAHEEISLEHDHVEIIGRLPDYYTGSGFRVAPILGVVDPNAPMEPNPEEVDYIFEAPLGFLMNTSNHRTGSIRYQGSERFFLEMPFGDHFIWGVTAGMINVLRNRVFS